MRLTAGGLGDLDQPLPTAENSEPLWGVDALPGGSWLQKGHTSSYLQLSHCFARRAWEGLWEQFQLSAKQSKRQGMVRVCGRVTALWEPSRKRPAAGVASVRRKLCCHSSMITHLIPQGWWMRSGSWAGAAQQWQSQRMQRDTRQQGCAAAGEEPRN